MTWAFDVASNIPRLNQSGTETGLAGIATAIGALPSVARSTAYTTAKMVKPQHLRAFGIVVQLLALRRQVRQHMARHWAARQQMVRRSLRPSKPLIFRLWVRPITTTCQTFGWPSTVR